MENTVVADEVEQEAEAWCTPQQLAERHGISARWARKLCRRVLGRRKYYRLNDDERQRVECEYRRWRRAEARPEAPAPAQNASL